VFGAVTKPERAGRKYIPSPEHIERLRVYNAARAAARARKEEAANVAGKKIEGCVLEVCAAGTATTERVAAT
jgi:hypothetical protein